jgi:hypothetical protein
MRIGCDLDGVLADLHPAFVEAARRLYPELGATVVLPADIGASPPDPEAHGTASSVGEAPTIERERPPLSASQQGRVWRALCAVPDFWDTLAETEAGIVARLAGLAEERRWDVIFLTSRPRTAGRAVQRQSQHWLDRLGFPLPSVFVVHGSRGRIAEALDLDVVIDDRPENCLDVVLESKARAILVWRDAADRVPASAKRLGIGVVSSVSACLDTLADADRTSGSPRDLMDRLRRLFGLSIRGGS